VSRQVRHRSSHASLLRDVSTSVVPPSRSRLDAIVVPAARPASDLQNVIELSAALSVPLVVLCSRQTSGEQVAKRVEKCWGARALVVDVPPTYQPPEQATSSRRFLDASADRSSDLSLKRNIGLLLARLRGWSKILFIDDDIRSLRPNDVSRLTSVLDRSPVASMTTRRFEDNSVVCHARRVAGFQQDIFVGGAVLGVQVHHPELSFFPDIYNEDWLFFARRAAERHLPKVGEVRQLDYLPFHDPERAAREEFGDLLAEGLFALFGSTPGWEFEEQLALAARASYWHAFQETRLAMIEETLGKLTQAHHPRAREAVKSLERATTQAEQINADLCVDYLEAWQHDDRNWQKRLVNLSATSSDRYALEELGLPGGITCGYGAELVSR
jgi:hypothetical protein